ncbi:MAG: NRDE family protein [Limnobacter sp.]|nr:NRDE family protein [Limnobacter sp.]
MCIAALAINQHPDYPFICLANRDEFHNRPTAPMQWWPDGQTLAGIDLQAKGTWMGIHESGRFALLTNVRNPQLESRAEAPSRGSLVSDFLQKGELPAAEKRKEMAGYNLISGHLGQNTFSFHTNQFEKSGDVDTARMVNLTDGIYCLSNGTLNSPWPKCLRLGHSLQNALQDIVNPDQDYFFKLLADESLANDAELPSTGVPYEWEKMLSAIKIISPVYGTRSTTVLKVRKDLTINMEEKTFHADGSLASKESFKHTLARG